MSSSFNFEKTNPAWDLRLWQQRSSEWFERILSSWQPIDSPDSLNNPVRPPTIPAQLWTLIFWLLVLALVTTIVWNLYPIVHRYLTKSQPERPLASSPKPIHRTQNQWLQQAKKAQSQGDYTQACRALYFAMVTKLQDQTLLSKDPSLTNGEYRRLLKTRSASYRTLINAHDESLYTDRPITQDRYAECDRAYRDIDQEMP